MVHIVPKPEFTSEEEIHAYYQGYANGVLAFAHWRDGVQYVGTCEHRLQDVMNELLDEKAQAYATLHKQLQESSGN